MRGFDFSQIDAVGDVAPVSCVRTAKRTRPREIHCFVKESHYISRCSSNSLTRTLARSQVNVQPNAKGLELFHEDIVKHDTMKLIICCAAANLVHSSCALHHVLLQIRGVVCRVTFLLRSWTR